jgi:hypothetical protein
MRQRLADALGKHRSFVTQIISPAYSIPMPVKTFGGYLSRLPFQPGRAAAFLERLSPGASGGQDVDRIRHAQDAAWSLIVPDFGDDKQNAALDRAVNDFIQKITSITGKGG